MRHILGPPLIALLLLFAACAPISAADAVPDDPTIVALDVHEMGVMNSSPSNADEGPIVIEDTTGMVLAVVMIEPAKHNVVADTREPDRINIARSLYLASLDLLGTANCMRGSSADDEEAHAEVVLALDAPMPHLRC